MFDFFVVYPWKNETPLMLAPMQGLTNRALREVYCRHAKPDVVFTEFVRVRPHAKKLLSDSDLIEATQKSSNVPLVVQVIGCADEGVERALTMLLERGVTHINVNMGCPWGRMTSVLSGGGMFKYPETIAPMLDKLRAKVKGSLSVKTRLGIDDERQILKLLPIFENAGVDFLIVHARTVKQKYKGRANHELTREIALASKIPLIANGDIRSKEDAERVLKQTHAKGLMIGRGAIADPWLFEKIRGTRDDNESAHEFKDNMRRHLHELLERYARLFCGDAQILAKMKEVLTHIDDESMRRLVKSLKKQKSVEGFRAALLAE